MLRVVIDTSSLVSYALTRGEITSRVIALWRDGEIRLLTSSSTRTELAQVVARPAIRQRSVAPLDKLTQGLERFSEHVPGNLELFGACRDPKDDKFLACAVEGRAHYLISSDRDLLDMRQYEGICIVNPGQFLLAWELASLTSQEMTSRFGLPTLATIRDTICLEPDTKSRLLKALALAPS